MRAQPHRLCDAPSSLHGPRSGIIEGMNDFHARSLLIAKAGDAFRPLSLCSTNFSSHSTATWCIGSAQCASSHTEFPANGMHSHIDTTADSLHSACTSAAALRGAAPASRALDTSS